MKAAAITVNAYWKPRHTIFVLGNEYRGQIRDDIRDESQQNRDILLVDIVDCYRNMTLKSAAILQWISAFCNSSRFFLQGDPDSIIFHQNTLDFLEKQDEAKAQIFGSCCFRAKVFRERGSKWLVLCCWFVGVLLFGVLILANCKEQVMRPRV
ncbi:UDP-GlcNAc:betaGal beta-1,3-N-acetylglucosaminyltransferase 9 [Toxocara canis]|uniref:Hexosyltransferase n=1 Tax=Toxocara canis TaxID=6265 RepID=A0A0B2UUZ3_TOXCA|nr:UDP-GlcNAc:betaGal beta-1,3-N-acetylglucosaminyltransferase 9 [Toxocara canis]